MVSFFASTYAIEQTAGASVYILLYSMNTLRFCLEFSGACVPEPIYYFVVATPSPGVQRRDTEAVFSKGIEVRALLYEGAVSGEEKTGQKVFVK